MVWAGGKGCHRPFSVQTVSGRASIRHNHKLKIPYPTRSLSVGVGEYPSVPLRVTSVGINRLVDARSHGEGKVPVVVHTGSDAFVGPAQGIDSGLFGYRYVGFRGLDRFEAQTAESPAGMIGWPGGYLVEDRDDIFGLEYAATGLVNPTPPAGAPDLPSVGEMMDFAIRHDQGFALTLPTMHWYDNIEGMRAQVSLFMENLLSGAFGPVPDNFTIEVGSEYYGHAPHLDMTAEEMAPIYGEIASAMIDEIRSAENDPAIKRLGVDVRIGVQGGRSDEAGTAIVGAMPPEALREIDLVILARMPQNFGGVDREMSEYESLFSTWSEAIVDAGGVPPEVFMTSFNVASPTREEALRAYSSTLGSDQQDLIPTAEELAARSDAAFEQFWQDRIARFDLGLDQPKVLMELFAEFHQMGMVSGTAFGVDQFYPGRLSYVDQAGNPVSMLGMDFMNFLYESVDDTRMLDVSVTNAVRTQNPVYAFEGDQHTTIFVMGGRTPGEVELDIEGLSSDFTRAYVDTLTPEVPEDWMARYRILDNATVDETPEGETFADTVEGTQAPSFRDGNLVVRVEEPGQILRIVLTHSELGEAQVEEWVVDPTASVDLMALFPDDLGDDPDPPPEEPPPDEDDGEVADGGGDGGMGMLALLLLPLLALAGMG